MQQPSIYSKINNQELKIKHSHYTCNYFVITTSLVRFTRRAAQIEDIKGHRGQD